MTDSPLRWRKSTHSGSQQACVEMARGADGTIHLRNSNHPGDGTLTVGPSELAAWLTAGKTGHLDDLAL
jgi:hypothetical protein